MAVSRLVWSGYAAGVIVVLYSATTTGGSGATKYLMWCVLTRNRKMAD